MTVVTDSLTSRGTRVGGDFADGLQRAFLQAASEASDDAVACRRVASVLAPVIEAIGIWSVTRQEDGNWSEPDPLCIPDEGEGEDGPASLHSPESGNLASMLDAACRQSQVTRFTTEACEEAFLAAPVLLRGKPSQVLLALTRSKTCDEHTIATTSALLQLASTAVTLRHMLDNAGQLESALQLASFHQETLRLSSIADDLDHASSLLTNHLAGLFSGCEAVAIGICGAAGQAILNAVSGVAKVDRHSELARSFEAVMDEALAARTPLRYVETDSTNRSSIDPAESDGGIAARTLCATLHVPSLIAAPVFDNHRPVAVWLVAGDESLAEQAARLDEASSLTRPAIARMHRQASRAGIKGRTRQMVNWVRSKPGVAALAIAVLVGLLIPWPYSIPCDSTVEPVTRRFVVAPYDGILEKQLVERGDVVERGQILARMDGREQRIRQSAIRADLSSERKKRDSARALGDHADAQIAGLEVERLEQELSLSEHRSKNLEVRSPVDGIVVSGDLQQAEGAPLEQGQTLYEVSPLDQMVVEVRIPEAEVRHIEAGAQARIWLDAFPNRPWRGVVRRVHPRAEMHDNESVFVAEVRLDNSHRLLRPGMNGRTRLRGPIRPVAWNLFHRAWERLLGKMGW